MSGTFETKSLAMPWSWSAPLVRAIEAVREARIPIFCYLLSASVICGGVLLGRSVIQDIRGEKLEGFTYIMMFNWDAGWYTSIADKGYRYDSRFQSSVNFFPAFPLLGTAVSRLTGLFPGKALLLVSNACFLATLVMMFKYVQLRFRDQAASYPLFVLLALALYPFNFYYVMAYSEALFMLVAIATLYAIERKSPLWVIALCAGLASAVRLPGLALVLPLLMAIWQRSPSLRSFTLRSAWLVPVGCWGILAFMALQWAKFDAPLAFVQTQVHWQGLKPTLLEKAGALVSLKPIWGVFLSGPRSWHAFRPYPGVSPLFVGILWHTVFFTLSAALVAIGAWKRWLNGYEIVVGAALLLIPYAAKSVEMNMCSMGRYATVAFPMYLVLGRWLSQLPRWASTSTLTISACWLGLNAMLFGSWFAFY